MLLGCGSPPASSGLPPAPPPPAVATPVPSTSGSAHVADANEPQSLEGRRKVRLMLERVAKARGLPILSDVKSVVLDRAAILDRIRTHVDKEIPRDAIESEGELLAALELVPADYDFVEGTYKLIQGRIAGFYEPSDHTMYLVDDLTEDEAVETLAHELVHALQDQSFSIARLIEYAPGDGDRGAAAHAVIEGDATSAMLDVTVGSAFRVSPQALRALMAASTAGSTVGKTAPHVLQSSLGAPYTDGFEFVQERRDKGGWAAVDAAIRAMPASTEQLLHPDKYAAREPPIAVDVPTFAALGSGFRKMIDDVIGEQSLRLMLEEWVPRPRAEAGAAGWGGDRYVIARRDDAGGAKAIAVGWRAIMDTERDATELAEILERPFGKSCRERATLGPFAWRRHGKELAIAAGPYVRQGGATRSAGDCRVAKAWLDELLSQRAPAGASGRAPGDRSP